MGQYGNQPDFGTEAKTIVPTGAADDIQNAPPIIIKPAALYIGTGGDLIVTVVGGNTGGLQETTIFKNIPEGTFFPVVVTSVWASNSDYSTTCSDIVALY